MWHICYYVRWYRNRSYRSCIWWGWCQCRKKLWPSICTVCKRQGRAYSRDSVCRYVGKGCRSWGIKGLKRQKAALRCSEIWAWVSTLLEMWQASYLLCKRVMVHQGDSSKGWPYQKQQYSKLDSWVYRFRTFRKLAWEYTGLGYLT